MVFKINRNLTRLKKNFQRRYQTFNNRICSPQSKVACCLSLLIIIIYLLLSIHIHQQFEKGAIQLKHQYSAQSHSTFENQINKVTDDLEENQNLFVDEKNDNNLNLDFEPSKLHPVVEQLNKKYNIDYGIPTEDRLHGIFGFSTRKIPLWVPNPIKFRLTEQQLIESHTGYCFNSRKSQSLPLDRTVPDYSNKLCRAEVFDYDNMKEASVIIIFHNEDYSVLLRSIHSVLNRTPPKLLKEIILVDDNSNSTTHPWLFDDLDFYLLHVPKTVIRRLQTRHGLMRARMAGIEWVRSEIFVILDSHIETMQRWLEFLIQALQKNPKMIVTPQIYSINSHTFKFENIFSSAIGFSWTMGQVHLNRKNIDGYKYEESPVMAGGLFAATKQWFTDIGGYDKELRLYGGEEFEIGFKTWMCGGSLYSIPCSKVGHVYRTSKYWNHQVYKVPGEEITRNKRRVALAWMDDYYRIVNYTLSQVDIPIGSVETSLEIRKKLNCHPFSWFLKHIYPELYVPDMKSLQILSVQLKKTKLCLDTFETEGEYYGLYPCHNQHGNQIYLFENNKISALSSSLNQCLIFDPKPSENFQFKKKEYTKQLSDIESVDKADIKGYVKSSICPTAEDDQTKLYYNKTSNKIHVQNTNLCLEGISSTLPKYIIVTSCRDTFLQKFILYS